MTYTHFTHIMTYTHFDICNEYAQVLTCQSSTVSEDSMCNCELKVKVMISNPSMDISFYPTLVVTVLLSFIVGKVLTHQNSTLAM